MKITKMPFEKSTYVLSQEITISELMLLREWLDTKGQGHYKIVAQNMIKIFNPSVETMFILKWVK